ncbi:hypothetical protein LSH36_233g08046 [Paralvinella palmiformis]|uniref:Uncharacterized protein n=1 Tax=Paralvinella palmiformis TaxID=53620 RepID=A0AAD9N3F3_9ANNE|nr:hypothetical protein LSH36_233g08046 [Paralvinella palmiformis]
MTSSYVIGVFVPIWDATCPHAIQQIASVTIRCRNMGSIVLHLAPTKQGRLFLRARQTNNNLTVGITSPLEL